MNVYILVDGRSSSSDASNSSNASNSNSTSTSSSHKAIGNIYTILWFQINGMWFEYVWWILVRSTQQCMESRGHNFKVKCSRHMHKWNKCPTVFMVCIVETISSRIVRWWRWSSCVVCDCATFKHFMILWNATKTGLIPHVKMFCSFFLVYFIVGAF